MVGRQSSVKILVLSLMIGFFVGAIYYPLATNEAVWEPGRLGVGPHEPHVAMGGATNEGDDMISLEYRVADTNASIYVMSPEDWNKTRNGTLTYDAARSFEHITNSSVVVELPSRYTAWIYAGDSVDGSVYQVERELQRPGVIEVFLVGLGALVGTFVLVSSILALIGRRA